MSSTSDVAASRNPMGTASLIIAIVAVVVGLAQQILSITVPLIMVRQGLSVSAVGAILVPGNVVVGLLAAVALVLGIVALTRRGSPRLAAAAGTAVAAHVLLSLIVAVVGSLLVAAI